VRIVFIGTSRFAVPSLALLAERYEIPLVITQPDRPAGRGRRLSAPPVKEEALRLGLPVVQPERVNSDGPIATIREASPDLIVVVAYGQILRPKLFTIPPHGTVNIHASLLPAYRGAAPVNWAIINGETTTGITTFLIDEGMDTGDILLQRSLPIGMDETAGELEARLARLGAEGIRETIEGLSTGKLEPRPQPPTGASLAPRLSREDGRIDWERPARKVHDLVRGTNPWPGAWTLLDEERVKVHRTALTGIGKGQIQPGEIALPETGRLLVGCRDDLIEVLEIQREGRPRTSGKAFLNGLRDERRFV